MKLRLLLPGVIALLLFIAACAPPPPLRDDTLLQDTSLITNEPCAAPCWNGITPGETAWNDALTALEDDPSLTNITTQEAEDSSAKVVEWQPVDGTACCQMYTEDGETVSVIFLRVAPLVTVGELIEAQGEPTYLVGSEFSDDQAIMNLIYPEQSIVIYAFVEGTAGSLNEDSEIVGVLYLTPEDVQLLIDTTSLQAWEGYQSYQTYAESEYEVTPSVTLTPTPEGG